MRVPPAPGVIACAGGLHWAARPRLPISPRDLVEMGQQPELGYVLKMTVPYWLNQICRIGVCGFSALALAVVIAPALQASPTATITASGTVPETAAVEVRPNPSPEPPALSEGGSLLTVANQQTVQIIANVPSQLALSRLQLDGPQGLNPGAVGAEIKLSANGSFLIGATTNAGGNAQFDAGFVAASVNASFYSTTAQPLMAGTYTASTVISVVAD